MKFPFLLLPVIALVWSCSKPESPARVKADAERPWRPTRQLVAAADAGEVLTEAEAQRVSAYRQGYWSDVVEPLSLEPILKKRKESGEASLTPEQLDMLDEYVSGRMAKMMAKNEAEIRKSDLEAEVREAREAKQAKAKAENEARWAAAEEAEYREKQDRLAEKEDRRRQDEASERIRAQQAESRLREREAYEAAERHRQLLEALRDRDRR